MASVSAHAQFTQINSLKGSSTFGQEERQYHFRSTSSYSYSGSSLPLAAQTGVVVGSTTPGDNSPTGTSGSGARRSKMDDDPFGGETIGDVNNPQQPGTPLGDGMWVLLMMAGAYVVCRKRKREVIA